jgi:phytanoyl-CoA hydroxylase
VLTVDAERFDVGPALAQLAADGWARIGPVVAPQTVAALGARVDDIMSARVRYEGMFFQKDSGTGRYEDLSFGKGWQGPSEEYRKIEKLELDPLFAEFMRNALYEKVARALIAGPVALYRAVLFTKSARGGTELPWHQDGGEFWGVDRPPTLQIWVALDDCELDGGCVEVLPGSHRGGLATREGGVIGEELLRAAGAEERAVALPARAGEVLLIHNHVWHRSRVNRTGKRRSALSVCLMSAETRCRRRKRAPREFVRVFE